jgi:hypothetical protein
MAHKLDSRERPETKSLLAGLPAMRHVPLVSELDLEEAAKVLRKMPRLEFPIGSASELVDKLGGGDASFEVEGVKVEPIRMVKYVPAHYFPIVSLENLVEKMADLIRQHRRQVDVDAEMRSIGKQLPPLKFPIAGRDELLRALTSARRKNYTFQGGKVDPAKIVTRIPDHAFPFQSRDDFERKIRRLMQSIPLIVGH